jgi:hypothetical protein
MNKINQSIDILDKSSFNCLLNLNQTYEMIIKNISDIRCHKECISGDFDREDFLLKVETDKFRELFTKLFKVVSGHKIMNKEKEILFLEDKEIICFSKTHKSRVDLIFPIQGDLISFNPKYEKVKNNGQGHVEIYIELKDDFHIWEMVNARLKSAK